LELTDNYNTMKLILPKKIYTTDNDGYLPCYDLWDEHFAILCAQQDQFILTAHHWSIIYFLRKYYNEYQIAPNIIILKKRMKKEWRIYRIADFESLFLSLFPDKKTKGLSIMIRYAGLNLPTVYI